MSVRRQGGLSLLEFTLVVIVVATLAALAADRISAMRVYMERAAVQRTVAAMRTALAMEFAAAVARDRRQDIAEWEGGNALALLEGRPVLGRAPGDPGMVTETGRESVRDDVGEVGEEVGGDGRQPRPEAAALLGPGRWHYDAERAEVVYRVAYPPAGTEGTPEGRWRVVVQGDDEPHGLELVNVTPVEW